WMPVGPIEDSLEQRAILCRVASQAFRERHCFLFRKIIQLDSPADVERRGASVADQLGRIHNAEKAKREAIHLGVFVAKVVAFANPGKELVSRKLKTSNRINLIDKDRQTSRV